MKQFILGGARSGKSLYAENLASAREALDPNMRIVYIATAHRGDEEMQARITQHQMRRPRHWLCIEEPLHLAARIKEFEHENVVVLVDCLTVWLSNLLFSEETHFPEVGTIEPPKTLQNELVDFLTVLQNYRGHILLISNEVGTGIVPMGAISRFYVDEAGRMNQRVAAMCDDVRYIVAGLPIKLKPSN